MMLFVCPLGVEPLLAAELRALGAAELTLGSAAVRAELPAAADEAGIGGLRLGLRACLRSRLASRVAWQIGTFAATDREGLYAGILALPWSDLLRPGGTLAVACTRGEGSLHNPLFVAQVVKDAIVDRLLAAGHPRPVIDRTEPDARILVAITKGSVAVRFDLAGRSLHRRGYRLMSGQAALQETLAAAVLVRAGWPEAAARGEPFIDPMCGSGTLLCEAAAMARDLPANALRPRFGLEGLACLPPALWHEEREAARALQREALGRPRPAPLFGFDASASQLGLAARALGSLGLQGDVTLRKALLANFAPAAHGITGPGLIVTNPPHGRRLLAKGASELVLLQQLGGALRKHDGWRASVLVGEADDGHALALRARRRWHLVSGGQPIVHLHFELGVARDVTEQKANGPITPRGTAAAEGQKEHRAALATTVAAADEPQAEGADFAQRLAKVARRWQRYLVRQKIGAVRLYDGDLPEYAAAIDYYVAEGGDRWLYIQERAAPASVEDATAKKRLRAIVAHCVRVLQLSPENVIVYSRRRQRHLSEASRYGKREQSPRFFSLRERDATYRVSLEGYIDTGLYLDHRELRAHIRARAAGLNFLNLFGYTGTMTVSAALGGARASTTVDASNTYLDWTAQNLSLNRIGEGHVLVRADVMQWLRQAAEVGPNYDLIFVGPPTFSNSHGTGKLFDLAQDQTALITLAMGILQRGGALYFSTHARRFALDGALHQRFAVNELTKSYCPPDFARRRPFRLWRIVHK